MHGLFLASMFVILSETIGLNRKCLIIILYIFVPIYTVINTLYMFQTVVPVYRASPERNEDQFTSLSSQAITAEQEEEQKKT
jgi:hypothetical protein